MMKVIRDLVRKSLFKEIFQEWSLHIKEKEDGTTFANMYMGWMTAPSDDDLRRSTHLFVTFMRPRGWSDMMKVIGPALDKKVAAVFKTKAAATFYNLFRAEVDRHIRGYWEQFLLACKNNKEELGPRDWSPRSGVCKCGLLPWKCVCTQGKK
jgi:hypothetical protein